MIFALGTNHVILDITAYEKLYNDSQKLQKIEHTINVIIDDMPDNETANSLKSILATQLITIQPFRGIAYSSEDVEITPVYKK